MPTQEERDHLHKMAGFPEPPTAEEAMKLMKARSQLKQKVDEFKRVEQEAIEEKEADRWGERLNWIHTKYGVDGSGVDSGDQLDVIESEIRQAFNALESSLSRAQERLKRIEEMAIQSRFSKTCDCATCRGFDDIHRLATEDAKPSPEREEGV